jgi:hypothetical protein
MLGNPKISSLVKSDTTDSSIENHVVPFKGYGDSNFCGPQGCMRLQGKYPQVHPMAEFRRDSRTRTSIRTSFFLTSR